MLNQQEQAQTATSYEKCKLIYNILEQDPGKEIDIMAANRKRKELLSLIRDSKHPNGNMTAKSICWAHALISIKANRETYQRNGRTGLTKAHQDPTKWKQLQEALATIKEAQLAERIKAKAATILKERVTMTQKANFDELDIYITPKDLSAPDQTDEETLTTSDKSDQTVADNNERDTTGSTQKYKCFLDIMIDDDERYRTPTTKTIMVSNRKDNNNDDNNNHGNSNVRRPRHAPDIITIDSSNDSNLNQLQPTQAQATRTATDNQQSSHNTTPTITNNDQHRHHHSSGDDNSKARRRASYKEEIGKILRHATRRGELKFQVVWRHYDDMGEVWESEELIFNQHPGALKEYLKRIQRENKRSFLALARRHPHLITVTKQ